MQITKCAYGDCVATTKQPAKDRWTHFTDWKAFANGWYCPAHAHAIERVLRRGGFDNPENDPRGDDKAA
jgi:hypothetical protein